MAELSWARNTLADLGLYHKRVARMEDMAGMIGEVGIGVDSGYMDLVRFMVASRDTGLGYLLPIEAMIHLASTHSYDELKLRIARAASYYQYLYRKSIYG